MKNVSQDYIDKEVAEERQPVELYHIWTEGGANNWYYTSGDVSVSYNGDTYTPALITRGQTSYNSELDVSTLEVQFKHVDDAVVRFLSMNPITPTWISVMKLHRDQSPLEADVIFVGQISTVTFKGNLANAKCVGFEHFLKMPIPTWRYQLTCNHKLFDEYCKLSANDYKLTTTVTVSSDGTVLTSSDFSNYSSGYFTLGKAIFSGESRPIIAHSGDTITLAYKFYDLEDNDSVDVYPGCDGNIGTCKDKFNNLIHFLGFPFTPQDNPSLRSP